MPRLATRSVPWRTCISPPTTWPWASETSDRDVREQLFDEPVRDLMTPRSRVIEPDADLLDAAREMLRLDVHRLFVERHGRLVGVISQTDIVAAVATAKI